MLGRLGGGGLGSLISRWGSAIKAGVSEVVSVFRREGIVGGVSEVLSGRREVLQGVQRRGVLDALPETRRPGANLYVSTDLQLSKAMKANFKVTYIAPGETEAKTYLRSMLYNKDRSKKAIRQEFEKRLQQDVLMSDPESGVNKVSILQVDFVSLQQRSDVDYMWAPDDAPWD